MKRLKAKIAGLINPSTKREITQADRGEGVYITPLISGYIREGLLADVKKTRNPKRSKKITQPETNEDSESQSKPEDT